MSFWDNMKKLAQPYADDEYDDYDEDDDYVDDYDEPEEPVRREKRRVNPISNPAPVEDDEDDDFGFEPMTPVAAPSTAAPSRDFGGKVLNMASGNKQDVVLFRPSSFADTSKAADDLKNRKAVIINLESVDKAMARRVIDFLTGCVYALEGEVKKIAQSAYLFCPHNMKIVGDLDTLQAEVESYI